MHKKHYIVLFSLLLPSLFSHSNGFYLGMQGGYGVEKNSRIKFVTSESVLVKDNETGVGSIKAGYDFNPYLGTELRMGKANQRSEMEYHVSAYAKIQYPLANDLTFYGLIGTNSAVLKPYYDDGQTVNSLSYGAGMRIPLSDRFGLNVEFIQNSTHELHQLKSYQVGIDYRF